MAPPPHSRPPTHCRHTFTSSGAKEKMQPEPTVLDLLLQQEPQMDIVCSFHSI